MPKPGSMLIFQRVHPWKNCRNPGFSWISTLFGFRFWRLHTRERCVGTFLESVVELFCGVCIPESVVFERLWHRKTCFLACVLTSYFCTFDSKSFQNLHFFLKIIFFSLKIMFFVENLKYTQVSVPNKSGAEI